MRFYLERTARAVLTIWAALSLAFVLIRMIPGGPIQSIRAELMTSNPNMPIGQINSRLADRLAELNLDYGAPIYDQYITYMSSLAVGDLGYSFEFSRPVADIVGEALPWTLFVMTVATVLVFVIAITWGAIIAYKEGSILDTTSSSISILFSAIPFYVLAFILILFLGYQTGWFPTAYKKGPLVTIERSGHITFFLDVVYHATLPILSVVLTQAGLQTLAMRGNSIQVLGEDYVRVARLRGLADRRIATRYVARNAMLPLYTSFLTLIGFNLGASIILEQVFNYRGLGWYMFGALENNDYALVMGTFIVYTVALVLAVFVADLTYSKIDPRVQQGGASEAY